MSRFRPAPIPTRRRGVFALAVLASLAAWPAVAASGIDPMCDDESAVSDLLIDSADELGLEVVEHAASVKIRLGVVDQSPPTLLPTTPRVDRILRRIFDETPLDEGFTGANAPRSSAAPLVELKTPDLIEDPTQEVPIEPTGADSDVPAPYVDPRFPGLSDADAERYRRQMYRTDI